MTSFRDYLTDRDIEIIVACLGAAYYDNGGEYYRPEVGNTNLSFAIAAWQSSIFNFERAFPKIEGVQECVRDGNVFYIKFKSCRVSFFKYHFTTHAHTFRLHGTSANRAHIVSANEQLMLFSEPLRNLIVIHTGTPEEGLLEVHIGAPVSAERTGDGWVWRDQIFNQETDGAYQPSGRPPKVEPFNELEQPEVDVEPMPEAEEDDDAENRNL
jgi:hypothetical protein